MRRRGPVTEPELALGAVTTHPLAGAADADAGGLGRLRHRPLPVNHSQAELPTAFQTERRVSVQIHSVSSLVGLRCLAALSPPRRPGWTNLLRNYTYAPLAPGNRCRHLGLVGGGTLAASLRLARSRDVTKRDLSAAFPSCAVLGVDAPDVAAIVPLREPEGACASG
jgi:hypothetical protein